LQLQAELIFEGRCKCDCEIQAENKVPGANVFSAVGDGQELLAIIFIGAIWTALKPFPIILLTREAVMIVTDSTREFSDLVTTVFALLGMHLVLNSNIIEYFMDMKCNITGCKLDQKIFSKCIKMDYQLLSRKDAQEKR
jgi:hypothetical protein